MPFQSQAFSPEKYSLLYGTTESDVDTINVSIKQAGNEVFSNSFTSKRSGYINLRKDEGNIYLMIDDSSQFNYFLISGFSNLLYEGKSELVIEYNGIEKKYDLKTIWIEKPNTLNNPEYSIKLLIYIEKEEIVGELLSAHIYRGDCVR